jgi:hypothetical protein
MPTKVEMEKELRRLRNAAEDLDAYKQQVRDKAIEVAGEQGWCKSGLNETLRELDIEPVADSWRRTALVRIVYLCDNEEDEIRSISMDNHNWDSLSVQEFEVVTIEESEEVFDE